MSSKFNENDEVEFCNNKAKVLKVHEQFYFYSGDSPYYEYDIEVLTTGQKHTVPEASLSLLQAARRAKLCECGAWVIHWAQNEHSRWCPAYKDGSL